MGGTSEVASAPRPVRRGVAKYLADTWDPLVGERFPGRKAIQVNAPWDRRGRTRSGGWARGSQSVSSPLIRRAVSPRSTKGSMAARNASILSGSLRFTTFPSENVTSM